MARRIELPEITNQDIQKINRYLSRNYYSFEEVRNQLIIAFLLRTGIKTVPVIALNVDEYDKDSGVVTPSHPNAPKLITLDPATQELFNKYLVLRTKKIDFKPSSSAMFISDRGRERLSTRQIQRIVKEFAKKCELPQNISPKSFRHIVGIYYASLGLTNVTIDSILGNVAPWVKTDYRRLSKTPIKFDKQSKLLELKCKVHKVNLEEAKHKKYGPIWICPVKGCLYILNDLGQKILRIQNI